MLTELATAPNGDLKSLLKLLEQSLQQQVIIPSSFSSSKKQLYVNCHLKTTEGYLYPMKEGIFFGFRKPLLFFSWKEIQSINIEAMSKTFSLQIKTFKSDQTFDFSTIDQEEYPAISTFIKKFNLSITCESTASTTKKAEKEAEEGGTGKVPKEPKVVVDPAEESSDSSSEDEEDYQPSEHESIPEDYDENYGNDLAEGPQSGGEDDDDDEED
jgi:hypothetical protein